MAVSKGKKRSRSASPTYELQGDHDSENVIMSPSKRAESMICKKKHKTVIHQLKSPGSNTHTSHSVIRSVSQSTGHTAHASTSKSKPPSPSVERISRALKTQLLPTNKEMSIFRTLPEYNITYKNLMQHHSFSHHFQCCCVSC